MYEWYIWDECVEYILFDCDVKGNWNIVNHGDAIHWMDSPYAECWGVGVVLPLFFSIVISVDHSLKVMICFVLRRWPSFRFWWDFSRESDKFVEHISFFVSWIFIRIFIFLLLHSIGQRFGINNNLNCDKCQLDFQIHTLTDRLINYYVYMDIYSIWMNGKFWVWRSCDHTNASMFSCVCLHLLFAISQFCVPCTLYNGMRLHFTRFLFIYRVFHFHRTTRQPWIVLGDTRRKFH